MGRSVIGVRSECSSQTIRALICVLGILAAGCGGFNPSPRIASPPSMAPMPGMPFLPGAVPPPPRSVRPGDAPGLAARTMDSGSRAEACGEANRGRARDLGSASGRRRAEEVLQRQGAMLASNSRLSRARLLQQQGLIDAAYELLVDQLCDPGESDAIGVLEALAENRERAGDLERAIRFQERVVLARRGGRPDERAVEAYNLAKVARLYAELGDLESARARTLAAETILAALRPEDAPNLGTGYFGLALAYARMGDAPDVRRTAQRAREAFRRELSSRSGADAEALQLGLLSRVFVDVKDYGEAKRLASEALARPVTLPPGAEAAMAFMPAMQGMLAGLTAMLQQFAELTLADVALADGNGAEALLRLARYQDALRRSKQVTASINQMVGRTVGTAPGVGQMLGSAEALVNAKRYAELAELAWKYGQAYRMNGQPREATAQLVRAVDIIEQLRGFVAPDDRLTFFGRETGPYHLLVELVLDLPPGDWPADLTRANRGSTAADASFAYAEAARARLLSELVARGLATRSLPTDLPPDVARDERDLLAQAHAELQSGVPYDESPAYRRFQAFVEDLRTTQPRYVNLKYPAPVTARQVPVRDGEVVIVYSLLERRVATWLLRKDAPAQLFVTPVPRANVLATITRLRGSLEPDAEGQLPAFDEQASATLFRWLLAQPLQSVAVGTRVVIIPDSALATFPFDVLAPSPGKFVGDDYSVSYAPSATVLWFQRAFADKTPAADGTLILADPAYEDGSPDTTATRSADSTVRSTRAGALREYAVKHRVDVFSSLPGTRDEAALVARQVGTSPGQVDVRLGAEANEHDVKALDLTRYGRLHFATHGVLADDLPYLREPALVLAQVGDLQGEDGFLTMSEIVRLRLRADLTVLSACQTGLGREVTGEGTVSLTRAFLHAGSRSVVVSLWRVEDRATAALMGRFYRGLADGKPPAEALEQARRALRQNRAWAHPFFWAPFVVYTAD